MTSTSLLLKDLKQRIIACTADLRLREPIPEGRPASTQGDVRYRAPKVHYADVPAIRQTDGKKTSTSNTVPFVLIRMADQDYSVAGSPSTVDCLVAIHYMVYAPENDPEAGMDDLLNLADRIAILLSREQLWGDDHWRHDSPFKVIHGFGRSGSVYESGSQFVAPYYAGGIETTFTAAGLPKRIPHGIVDA